MLFDIYSLLSAGFFVTMDAVDVALTEAAVGAGVTTVLMLSTLALTSRKEKIRLSPPSLLPLAVVTITGLVLVYGTLDMPHLGDPDAPVHQHVEPRYIEQSFEEVGMPNIVTSVLASYRGFDTLGEVVVIFAAGLGVLALLGGLGGGRHKARPSAMGHHVVLRVITKALVPLILLYALYIQFHGDYGPGGGFQAGVVFAAGIILYAVVIGLTKAEQVITPTFLRYMMGAGALIFGGTGVVSLLLGGNFLDYNVLAHDPLHGQHYGIVAVEFGVGVTVAAVIISIFFNFFGRSSEPQEAEQ
jgi:multicomponent Na+:H+ antiporter subunit B